MHHQLYILRREKRLTQSDLAKLLRITRQAYQIKESGKSFFTLPEAILLADYFGVSLDELFRKERELVG